MTDINQLADNAKVFAFRKIFADKAGPLVLVIVIGFRKAIARQVNKIKARTLIQTFAQALGLQLIEIYRLRLARSRADACQTIAAAQRIDQRRFAYITATNKSSLNQGRLRILVSTYCRSNIFRANNIPHSFSHVNPPMPVSKLHPNVPQV